MVRTRGRGAQTFFHRHESSRTSERVVAAIRRLRIHVPVAEENKNNNERTNAWYSGALFQWHIAE